MGCLLLLRQAGLQTGQLAVLQFDQALQLVQLALQITHAAFEFRTGAPGGVQVLLGHRQLVGHCVGVAGILPLCRTALAAGDQSQAVAKLHLRRRRAGGGPPGSIQLAFAGNLTARLSPGLPGSVLLGHPGDGFATGAGGDLLLVGQAQHLAGLEQVDVVVDEGAGVQILDRQHGLLDRGVTTLMTRGDFPQRVMGDRTVFTLPLGLRRDGPHGGRCATRRLRRAGRGLTLRLGRRRGDSQLRCNIRAVLRVVERRIEQHGVLAKRTTTRPVHFDEEIQIGLAHRLAGTDADDALALGGDDRGELQVVQEEGTVDPGPLKLLRRGQRWHDFRGSQAPHIQQFDFRNQRLVQGRL